MKRRIMLVAAALAPCSVLSMIASGQTLSGTISWADAGGIFHPARSIRVDIMGLKSEGGEVLLGTAYTDLEGRYSHSFMVPPGGLTAVGAHAYADHASIAQIGVAGAGYVSADGTAATIYHWDDSIGGSQGVLDLYIKETAHLPTIPLARAFGVADAMYTAWHLGHVASRRSPPHRVGVIFPDTKTSYLPEVRLIRVDYARWTRWDVLHHEYGHYLAHVDEMGFVPGLPHSPLGTSSIPTLGKDLGTRFAWSEGLATYLGIASQHVRTAEQRLPALPGVGDERYQDGPGGFDLEDAAAITTAGEGDELAVARILWDIADRPSFDDDFIGLTHESVYRDLNYWITNLRRLDDVWDYYSRYTTWEARTHFGAIFEDHRVSPHPQNGPIGATFESTDGPPTFQWARRNNGANDKFGLIVWDARFWKRMFELEIPGDVESFTMPASEWAKLTDAARSGARVFYFIIHGSDTKDSSGAAYPGELVTGPYWSGKYSFSINGGPVAPRNESHRRAPAGTDK